MVRIKRMAWGLILTLMLTAICGGGSLAFASDLSPDEPVVPETIVYDMTDEQNDGLRVAADNPNNVTKINEKTEIVLATDFYSGSSRGAGKFARGAVVYTNPVAFTSGIDVGKAVVVLFDEVDTSVYPVMTVDMSAGAAPETLLFFGTQTELTADSAVHSEKYETENQKKTIKLDATEFADASGKISTLTVLRTQKTGQLFFNYIRFEKAEEPEEVVSLHLEAGENLASDKKDLLPALTTVQEGKDEYTLVSDPNVHWVNLVQYDKAAQNGNNQGGVAYLDYPAFVTYNEVRAGVAVENGKIKGKNILQAVALPHVKAENYAQFNMTYFFTDWDFGNHEFYVYKGGTEKFTDETGKPTGYLLKQENNGPQTKHTVTINDTTELADSTGYIDIIYILYGGEKSGAGYKTGAQFWVNELNLLIEDDVPKPVISEEFTEKDLSELLPVGDGVTFSMESSGIQPGETGFGAYKRIASAQTVAADVITFDFEPSYAADAQYSVYFLMKAEEGKAYNESGLLFWFAEDNILIGNGTKNDYAKALKKDFPADSFVSGKPTEIKIAAIPYYLEGVQGGYYMALWVNDAATPLLEKFVADGDIVTGDRTTVVLQDLGADYSVKLASAGTATAAADVMKVKVATANGKTSFDKPRATLELSHFAVEGETVSELTVEGDASFNAQTGVLTFNANGTVKVHYTVTNAFGTFKSNELELNYDDGTGASGNETPKKKRCGSFVGGFGVSGALAAVAFAAIAVIVSRRKRSRE